MDSGVGSLRWRCINRSHSVLPRQITLVVIGGRVHQFFVASEDLPQLSALHVNPPGSFLDLFKAEERSFPGSRTDVADLFPGLCTHEMRIPERPCSALNRASPIDSAFSTFRVKKRAITVFVFRQRDSTADDTRMEQPDFADRLVKVLGNLQKFVVGHPNNSRWPRAAIATLRTGKLQSVSIPWSGGFRRLFV